MRRLRSALTALLTLAALTALAPSAVAAPATCRAKNMRTSVVTTSPDGAALADAIDDAQPGDLIGVRGTCVGPYVLAKSLSIDGSQGAVVDGDALSSTFTVQQDVFENPVTVHLRDLTITNGNATFGGGLLVANGSIAFLDGSTHVTGNEASLGAGAMLVQGSSLRLRQSVEIDGNTGSDNGGGVFMNDSTLVFRGASTIHDNTGIGVYTCGASVVDGMVVGVNVYGNTPADTGAC